MYVEISGACGYEFGYVFGLTLVMNLNYVV